MIDFHAQFKPHFSENFFDFIERLMTEILGLQHILFGFLHQLANVFDVGVLQTILRSHRELELVNAAEQIIVERNRRAVI